jgi:hypothetical protein
MMMETNLRSKRADFDQADVQGMVEGENSQHKILVALQDILGNTDHGLQGEASVLGDADSLAFEHGIPKLAIVVDAEVMNVSARDAVVKIPSNPGGVWDSSRNRCGRRGSGRWGCRSRGGDGSNRNSGRYGSWNNEAVS